MHLRALICVILSLLSLTSSQAPEEKNGLVCGSSILDIKTSQTLSMPLEEVDKSSNIKITEGLNITECVNNCCSLLDDCQVAIVRNNTCYNVSIILSLLCC